MVFLKGKSEAYQEERGEKALIHGIALLDDCDNKNK